MPLATIVDHFHSLPLATSVAVFYLFIEFPGINKCSHVRGVAFGARNLAAKELTHMHSNTTTPAATEKWTT